MSWRTELARNNNIQLMETHAHLQSETYGVRKLGIDSLYHGANLSTYLASSSRTTIVFLSHLQFHRLDHGDIDPAFTALVSGVYIMKGSTRKDGIL